MSETCRRKQTIKLLLTFNLISFCTIFNEWLMGHHYYLIETCKVVTIAMNIYYFADYRIFYVLFYQRCSGILHTCVIIYLIPMTPFKSWIYNKLFSHFLCFTSLERKDNSIRLHTNEMMMQISVWSPGSFWIIL